MVILSWINTLFNVQRIHSKNRYNSIAYHKHLTYLYNLIINIILIKNTNSKCIITYFMWNYNQIAVTFDTNKLETINIEIVHVHKQ